MATELLHAIETHTGDTVIEWPVDYLMDEMENFISDDSDFVKLFMLAEWDKVDRWEYCGDKLIITLS